MRRIYSNRENDSDEVKIPFSQMLRESERADLAAPYFTWSELLLEVAGEGKKIRLLIELNGITSLDELRRILGRDGIKIKYFTKNFHAKIYIFDNITLLGSANLTRKGLTKNREAVIQLCREENSDAVQEVGKLFDELWNLGKDLTEEKLVHFEKEHEKLSRLIEESRIARKKFESEFEPVDASVPSSNGKPPILNGIDKKAEFHKACDMVFGKVMPKPKGNEKPPLQSIYGLNLYFNVRRNSRDVYRAYFLPESWANAMHKDGITWPDGCDFSGFFKQPLMADLFFDVRTGKARLFGRLVLPASPVRLKIVACIKETAENYNLEDKIKFDPKYHDGRSRSAFFIDNRYKLDRYDAESLTKIMKEAIEKFTPAINAIGESLAKLDLSS